MLKKLPALAEFVPAGVAPQPNSYWPILETVIGALPWMVGSIVAAALLSLFLKLFCPGFVFGVGRWKRTPFMNATERRLFSVLERAMPRHAVLPQTAIQAIIDPVNGASRSRRYMRAGNRVDFALMNRESGLVDAVIEFDGPHHDDRAQRRKDKFRDAAFARAGIASVRFRNIPSVEAARQQVLAVMARYSRGLR